MPVPVKLITSVELEALLMIETLPDVLPVTAGVKVTVKVELAPGAIEAGALKPLSANPVPETDTLEILADALPLFVRVIACFALPPSSTLPNATLAGLADNCP